MAATKFLRRDIWTLAEDDPIVTYYAGAVKRMRERDPDDPTSWSYQAAIHGTEASGGKPLWNQCQHGTWYFFPWHRMFIFFFEEIVRETVIEIEGPDDWALPYWNYGLPGPHATLPRPFRNPTLSSGEPNPLYESARAPGINSGATLSPEVTSPTAALARPHFVGAAEFGGGVTPAAQFSGQAGRLEETPHNAVHVAVGGSNGLMTRPLAAAQDPIFWLHHANIDRLWTVWNRTQVHADPAEAEWTQHGFVVFNKKGQEVELACENVIDPEDTLHYTYDEPQLFPSDVKRPPIGGLKMVEPSQQGERPQLVGATSKAVELVGRPVTVEVPIDAAAAGELKSDQHVYLNVEDIEGKRNPGVIYGIYVELPPDAARELEPAHHVGNLTFFGIEGARKPEGDEHAHGLRSAIEISKFARELAACSAWGGHPLSVTFRPIGLTPPETPDPRDLVASPEHREVPVSIGRVSVFYDA